MERKSALKELIPKAKNLAREMHETQVQPIHLLVTMLALSNGTCRQILEDMQVDIDGMLSEARSHLTKQDGPQSLPIVSARTKKLLERADRMAEDQGAVIAGTEHLLLAFASSRAAQISSIFKKFGVTYADIKDATEGLRQMASTDVPKNEAAARAKDKVVDKSNDWMRDLTACAARGELDGAFERDQEIAQMVCALLRRRKNCPALLGEPGVGKTALVEELAIQIASGEVPELEGTSLLAIDVAGMLAGTRYRGQFEERIQKMLQQAEKDNSILFIDEAHTIIGAGESSGGLDMSNMLKPYMARGMRFVLATTLEEYRKYMERDAALARRMMQITVAPPTVAQTIEIVNRAKSKYEDHHKLAISRECVHEAVVLANRYITERYFPDKALDVIDEACAAAALKKEGTLSLERVRRTVASISKVDITGGLAHVTDFASRAKELIRGQDESVDLVHKALIRSAAGIRDPQRPAGCFLFLGPTGVGKTQMAKTLAKLHMGNDDALIRVDCSELMEKSSISKLVGAPPGYVGHSEGGQLTEQVRRRPYSVVLFDEIEKAHPEVWNLLLQVMDDGRLTDSFGRTVNFTNCVIILTGNVGARSLEKRSMGFGEKSHGADEKAFRSAVLAAAKKTFPPEFINRLDETVVFHQLDNNVLGRIAADEIELLMKRSPRAIDCDQSVIDAVVEAALEHDPHGGARAIKRLVTTMVTDALSDVLLSSPNETDSLVIEWTDGKLAFRKLEEAPVEPLVAGELAET